MAIDGRHLRTFLAVAEQRHFRRAAERLYLSQPTVSAQIQALERELGAPLFWRQGGVRLTPAGERLLPYARAAVALEAEALDALRSWRLRFDERMRLVSSIFIAAAALPGCLRRLLLEWPRLDVSLRTGFSQEVLAAVAAGEAELGLSRLPPAGLELEGRQLGAEPVVAVVPAAWGVRTLPEALATGPLLSHNHPGYWDRLLAALSAAGLDCRPMEVRQVDVTCRLIEAGLGLSFLPLSAVAGNPQLAVLPGHPGLELPTTGSWAAWPRGRPPTAAGERLLQLLAAGPVIDLS